MKSESVGDIYCGDTNWCLLSNNGVTKTAPIPLFQIITYPIRDRTVQQGRKKVPQS